MFQRNSEQVYEDNDDEFDENDEFDERHDDRTRNTRYQENLKSKKRKFQEMLS